LKPFIVHDKIASDLLIRKHITPSVCDAVCFVAVQMRGSSTWQVLTWNLCTSMPI